MFNDLDPNNYIFMQDGAPAHKSSLTIPFLTKRCSFIKSWPANSPDLNPIEHLWGAMKSIIKKRRSEIKAYWSTVYIQILILGVHVRP